MFPLLLNLTGRAAVIIGGGNVGRRKAATLLAAGAQVRLVCLEPRPADETHSHLSWLTAAYDPAHLDGAALVFAAGPAELNRRVVADARAREVWVHSASEPATGDFTMPATVRRGDLLLTISTGGAAPALARRLREQLESQFDEAFGQWVALLAELRPLVQAAISDERLRRELFERWCQPEWLERLRRDGREAVRAALRGELASRSL